MAPRRKVHEREINQLTVFAEKVESVRSRLVKEDKVTKEEDYDLILARNYLDEAWRSMQRRLVTWKK